MLGIILRRFRANPGAAFLAASTLLVAAIGCSDSAPTAIPYQSPHNAAVDPCAITGCVSIPAFFGAFSSSVSVSRDKNDIVLKSNGVPDHKSPYFARRDRRYEAYSGTNPSFKLNPNRIAAHSFTFRIPLNPTKAVPPVPTSLGPIGIALNGVPLYNQYAAMWDSLTNEMNSFDQYNGHPQADSIYHYHVEPLWLTRASKEALVGMLLDGYPVYGPMEAGKFVSSRGLDAAHGHFGKTAEFPLGIYHYHTTAVSPYINGSGFAGVPGTVTY